MLVFFLILETSFICRRNPVIMQVEIWKKWWWNQRGWKETGGKKKKKKKSWSWLNIIKRKYIDFSLDGVCVFYGILWCTKNFPYKKNMKILQIIDKSWQKEQSSFFFFFFFFKFSSCYSCWSASSSTIIIWSFRLWVTDCLIYWQQETCGFCSWHNSIAFYNGWFPNTSFKIISDIFLHYINTIPNATVTWNEIK